MSVKLRNSLGFFFAILANFSLWSMETPVENSPKESWRKADIIHFDVQEKVLNIDKCKPMDLHLMINFDQMFAYHEQVLLDIIHDTVVFWGMSKVGNVKDLHAALAAIFGIIITDASRTALQLAMEAVGDTTAGSVKWDEARRKDWIAAANKLEDFEWDILGQTAMKNAWYGIYNINHEDAKTKLTAALNKLKIEDPEEKKQACFKLSNLFFLAFISHKGFLEQSDRVFTAVMKDLDNYNSTNTTKDGVIDFWARNYWNMEEYKLNSYMKIFKEIALKLAQSKKLN